jgi:ribosomal protein S14
MLCKHGVIGSIPIISKMKYLLLKDKRRRILFSLFEKKRKFLLAIYQNFQISLKLRFLAYSNLLLLSRDTSVTRVKNRCILTNRPRSIYKHYGLSRLMFRKYILQGKLIGVKKSSW